LFVDTEDDSNDNRKFKPKPNYQEVAPKTSSDGLIRLNKFISNSGICSRREADEIILEGKVKVNGQVITELGTKVKLTDTVTYKGKTLIPEKKVYILVNKPKDCVTTKDDPEERRTVFDLIQGSCFEQVHAVGRLDRNTTGVLLLTNDGELTQKLTHPKFNKRKIYHVWLDRNISEEDLRQLSNGVELEDGFVKPDDLSFVEPGDRKQLGIEIHSGQNRVVRRMFEHFQYKVLKLDRVYFAGLTKKSLPRGEWRYLTNEEVSILKRLSTR
jgi:23S rRNA pseudouridine2605 synthase